MPDLVIVALPSEDDYVNKISSEKVPHMTLLFLGDSEKVRNFNQILKFTEYAAKETLCRFGLEVDRRGELGEDQADVLFFKKSKWCGYPDIEAFRSNLLKENNIKTAYNSVEQFPEWIPHLTLGYPETPAHPDERDYPGITYVNFDRIAVWDKEFEGVEFPLDSYDEYDMMRMSAIGGVFLEHFGVKGMRWGHRKSSSDLSVKEISRGLSEKDLLKGHSLKDIEDAHNDAKWLKKNFASGHLSSLNPNAAVHAHPITKSIIKDASKNMKPEIKVINKKSEYNTKEAKKALKKNIFGKISNSKIYGSDNPIALKYNKEVSETYMKHIQEAASKRTGLSPSGKWQSEIVSGGKGSKGYWYIGLKSSDGVRHSDISDPDIAMLVRPIFDEDGYIVDIESVFNENDSIQQTAIEVVDKTFLEHFGVKGMRWGHHNPSSRSSSSYRAHPDAKISRDAEIKLKTKGIHTLSNQELQSLANRRNLEQRVRNSTPSTSHRVLKGSRLTAKFLNSPEAQLSMRVVKHPITRGAASAIVATAGAKALATVGATAVSTLILAYGRTKL